VFDFSYKTKYKGFIMNILRGIPDAISVKIPLKPPVGLIMDTGARMSTNTYTVGLRMLCTILRVNFINHLGSLMGRMGTLGRDGVRWVMRPKPIPQPALSNWINGKEKIPVWRLAQAVVLLEWIYVVMKAEAKAEELPEDDITRLHLELARRWFSEFNKEADLHPWLELLRRALHGQLERDAGRSENAKQLFQHYESWRAELLTMGEGKRNAKARPS
jgi:hypothetical protein